MLPDFVADKQINFRQRLANNGIVQGSVAASDHLDVWGPSRIIGIKFVP